MINNRYDILSRRIFAFIFARGGSKGLPGKNLLAINNKPLIAHSIDCAKKIPMIDRIYVSSDCPNILEVSSSYGAETIIRPAELGSDCSPEWLSWQHAVNAVTRQAGKFDVFVSLPATSPTRKKDDVEKCISCFCSSISNNTLVLTVAKAKRNPYFNMVSVSDNGCANRLIDIDSTISRRQDAPPAYDITNGCYVTSPRYILDSKSIWDEGVKAVIIPPENSIDIDTIFDFQMAKFLLEYNHEQDI